MHKGYCAVQWNRPGKLNLFNFMKSLLLAWKQLSCVHKSKLDLVQRTFVTTFELGLFIVVRRGITHGPVQTVRPGISNPLNVHLGIVFLLQQTLKSSELPRLELTKVWDGSLIPLETLWCLFVADPQCCPGATLQHDDPTISALQSYHLVSCLFFLRLTANPSPPSGFTSLPLVSLRTCFYTCSSVSSQTKRWRCQDKHLQPVFLSFLCSP